MFLDREAARAWLDLYLARCELEVDELGELISAEQRCEQMRQANPKYILRNYLAQLAIDKAEEGDFSELHRLAELLKRPFDEQPEFDDYAKLPPEWGKSTVFEWRARPWPVEGWSTVPTTSRLAGLPFHALTVRPIGVIR